MADENKKINRKMILAKTKITKESSNDKSRKTKNLKLISAINLKASGQR